MALSLAARLLIRPGDRVAVERYGYLPLWDTLRLAGAQLVPVSVDENGMCVHELEQLGKLRAIYLTPHHQYPTTVLLSPERRSWLLDWAKRERCAILEDDYDNEFHYRGQPVLPLMSADRAGVVLYIGGLSKVLAPGLRIGCLVGPASFIEQAAVLRRTIDHQGDQPTEAAVAELIKTGEVPRHIRRMRRVYAARRETLLEALDEFLPGCFEIRVPAGGMAIWARITDGTDPEHWSQEALKYGVEISTGRRFDIRNRKSPFLRLGFAANSEEEIVLAVQALAKARLQARRRRS
jgi:GntR family transcriptional regulator/MocR family aminotransferase